MAFKKVFGKNELNEIVNINALKYIIKNWHKYENSIIINDENDYDYNPKDICKKYVASYKNTITIKYNKSSKYLSKLGRWFCKSGLGIQSMPRVIRHTICKDLWIDLDFKNCHPVILQTLCKKHKIKCKYLTNYIENRDILLQEWADILKTTKDDIKTIFLASLNGNLTKYNIQNWDKILAEFANIHKTLSSLDEYKPLLEEVEALNTKNIYAKTVNRVLCNIENKCLETLYINLDKRGLLNVSINEVNYKCCALIFDGLQIPLNDMTAAFINEQNLTLMSSIIFNDTAYHLSLAVKEFNECLDIPEGYEDEIDKEEDDIYIENDLDAAEIIISKYADCMVQCNGVKYVKSGNVWVSNELKDDVIITIIYNWIVNTPMKKSVGKSYICYNRDKTCINKCLDVVLKVGFSVNQSSFISDNLLKCKDYLPFKNGVYSLKKKRLLKYEDVPIQFVRCIDRDYKNVKQTDKSMIELMEKIIIPTLPNEEEREYFFYCIARALAGRYEDKKWYINKGSRNSGKGVITKLLQNAFEVFIGIFNAGALIEKKMQNADDAKALSWVCGLKHCRLIISNEVKEDAILKGELIKSLSGGDTVLGRTNHKDEGQFNPQFMMMLMCNSLKGVEPQDTLENCEQFYCKSKFVPKEELIEGQPFLKLMDKNIKNIVSQSDIIDAFTSYVLSHFAEHKETPKCIQLSTQDMKKDIPLTLEQVILKIFRTSSNNKERLFSTDIISYIMQNGYKDHPNTKDISTIFIKCNIGTRSESGNTTINKEKKKGFENIVYIPQNTEEADESDDE